MLAVLAVLGSACISQQSPERQPLPDVSDVVSAPLPCSVVIGESRGVRIESILAGSPAEGQLVAEDELRSVDGETITALADIRRALSDRAPGDVVDVVADRGGAGIDVSIELTTAPDGETPLLGITASEVYDEVPLSDVSGTPPPTPLSRLVQVGEVFLGLDAASPSVGRIDLTLPDTDFWQVVGGAAYWVDDPGGAAIMRSSDGVVVEAWDEEVSPARLLGIVGDDLVGVFLDPSGVSVRRFDPHGTDASWVTRPNTEIGLPVVTYASPDQSLLLLGMGTAESLELRYLVLDAGSGAIRTELEDLAGVSVFGWFDDQRLVTQSGADMLTLTSVLDGTTETVDLPTFSSVDVRLWPVGDGRHLLLDTGSQLLRTEVGNDAATRPIVARCQIGQVGQPGSGA